MEKTDDFGSETFFAGSAATRPRVVSASASAYAVSFASKLDGYHTMFAVFYRHKVQDDHRGHGHHL